MAEELGFDIDWQGSGVEEIGVDRNTGKQIIAVDPKYFRPTEVETLLGDPTKAKVNLGWVPEITAQEMCAEMVADDHKAARRSKLLKEHGLELQVSLEN